MDIQAQVLLFFSGLHGSVLDAIATCATLFGEQYVVVGVIALIYWCVDKEKGFAIGMCSLVASLVMNIIKPILAIPRPWTRIDGLDVIRQHTATGYSFPSGHTTTSSAVCVAIARAFRKKWLTVLCVVILVLVGLSRVYLCVHWPMDVLAGYLIGIGITLLFYDSFFRCGAGQGRTLQILAVLGAIATVAFVVLALLLTVGLVEEIAAGDLTKNLALISGALLGYVFEMRSNGFVIEKGHTARKLSRFLLGLAGDLFILYVLKVILVALAFYSPILQMLRYCLVGLWSFYLWPLLGVKLHLFECAKQNEECL